MDSRQQDILNRIKTLNDAGFAFQNLHPEVKNMGLWVKSLLKNQDHEEAESLLLALEAKDLELSPSKEDRARERSESKLRKALKKAKISEFRLLEAFVRKEFLGDTSMIDSLKEKLEEIYERGSKP